MAEKAWGGRFLQETDSRVESFTESISFDHRLFHHDIGASTAHAQMLCEVGLLSKDECQRIERSLMEIHAEIEEGRFKFDIAKEDIHMHIESALIERLGDLGRKLHTARSRNDQVATDLRLWTREALREVDQRLIDLQVALVGAAERHADVILPGYTHLQRAQPVLAGHYFLAYVEKFERDRQRLEDCLKRVNILPLGSAALAGSSLPIDRESVARKLQFAGVSANSIDGSSDRDFALESVFVLTMVAEHLSGWAEEWVIWSTQEFGFLDLPDAFCTGSSIMPQKKNPDVLELIRGRSARVIGSLTTLLVLIKGLPLAYNRDLQEDKPPLFQAFDTVMGCLELASAVIHGARLRTKAIEARLDEGFLDATTLMEFLIERGLPQRSAHEVIGKLVAKCERKGLKKLTQLTDSEMTEAHPLLDPSARSVLGARGAINAFRSAGSTAPSEVQKQLSIWKTRLQALNPSGIAVHPLENT